MAEPVVMSWSGGKDSALALHELRNDRRYNVVALLTSVSAQYDRVSHHGVRVELLERQAESIGLPLHTIALPSGSGQPCTNQIYEQEMNRALRPFHDSDVRTVAHGDIFLEDLRAYRERNLAQAGMRGVFPLWQRDTGELMRRFIQLGFQAYTSCVEGKLGPEFVGRRIDEDFVSRLPDGIDPCGEYGEYHSFVYAGPIFARPLAVRVGTKVTRDGRHYADLLLSETDAGEAVSEANIPPVV